MTRHQVIVHAEAFGAAQEHDLLKPMMEGTRENFKEIGNKQDVFEKAKLVADSGYHTEANMQMVMEEGIDAYIADTQFRKRDPRFADVDKYKERFRKEQGRVLWNKRFVPGEGLHDERRQEVLHLSGRQAALS